MPPPATCGRDSHHVSAEPVQQWAEHESGGEVKGSVDDYFCCGCRGPRGRHRPCSAYAWRQVCGKWIRVSGATGRLRRALATSYGRESTPGRIPAGPASAGTATVVSRPHCEQTVIVSVLPAPMTSLPLALARLAALGLVLELLIVEELLFSRCENKLGIAFRALQDPILELRHNPTWFLERVVKRAGRDLPVHLVGCYSTSRRDFFRFRLRASACFTRFFSPGFK